MKKKIFMYLFVILLSTVLLTGCTKKDQEEVEEESLVQQEESVGVEEEVEEVTDLGSLSSPEEFTSTKQTLGQENDFEYTIATIADEKGNGYHDFTFELTSSQEGATTPLVVAEPVLNRGVVTIRFVNIVGDTTGLTHAKSIDVNTGAITALKRMVTSVSDGRVYEVGVLTNNKFKLEQISNEGGSWIFSLKVAYDTKYSPPDIDFGSEDFSSELQSITGMSASDGVKITNYSYVFSSGVLKFSLSVASGTSNPIPSVSAQYDDRGVLVVTFESLESDKVSGWGSKIDLVSGVSVLVSRSGQKSVYEFIGISNNKPYRLSATQSPNSVNVEIKI